MVLLNFFCDFEWFFCEFIKFGYFYLFYLVVGLFKILLILGVSNLKIKLINVFLNNSVCVRKYVEFKKKKNLVLLFLIIFIVGVFSDETLCTCLVCKR